MRTRPVTGGVNRLPPRGRVGARCAVIGVWARLRWARHRLREWVPRQLRLEVEEPWVFVDETIIAGVGRKDAPLIGADHGGEKGALGGRTGE